ncbi:LacI family transcriptional regulator [Virgisporangium aliadipatigenens]|uniref:LacI family transcriptional regulator n=1 Tax=Virgisporangium aliadipatigenens TaxID=741659 RepID=A0A8J4DTP4_9ACTN|nr:LacI family DNA-binding transcriptional regulator [Virgisporangium aliadipatigenens]GIJ49974.1 LacI family transcriptional regulator [Virgisporangium aliadipatigenens]
MGATLQTVADQVGVSRSTVSNAYSRPDQLSPELRARILAVAERLGYPGPNPSARSLRRGKVDAIGVLLTANLSMAFRDPYAVAYLRGLAEAAEQRKTSLLLIPLPHNDQEGALDAVRNAAVDAFCVYCVPDWFKALEIINFRGLPVVGGEDPAITGQLSGEVGFVGIDERKAARRLAAHVAALGHRRVALIGHWITDTSVTGPVDVHPDELRYYVSGERVRGFRDALVAAGVDLADVVLINAAENDRLVGAEAAGHALDRQDRCTAILSTSDVLALGVLDALAVRGLRPGRDVSVTGFDDIPEAAAVGLTTIRQPSVERGRIAGELLLDPPADPQARHRVLPTTLVVRATTGPINQESSS